MVHGPYRIPVTCLCFETRYQGPARPLDASCSLLKSSRSPSRTLRDDAGASAPVKDRGPLSGKQDGESETQVRKISNVVYALMKNRILSLHYQPGTLLTERALAEDLEVSRTPVREAIQRLAQEGWLRINARRNIQVRDVTIADFGEVFQARRMIEPAAVDLAFSTGIAASLPWKLDEAMANMGASRGDLYSFITADQAFHAVFFDELHNSRLSRMWKTLSEDMVWLGILAMGHDERRYAIVTKRARADRRVRAAQAP